MPSLSRESVSTALELFRLVGKTVAARPSLVFAGGGGGDVGEESGYYASSAG